MSWEEQLGDKDIYVKDPGPLLTTIHMTIEKNSKRRELNADKMQYFMVKDPEFACFYLLSKTHQLLHDVSGWPVISNCGYYNGNRSSF